MIKNLRTAFAVAIVAFASLLLVVSSSAQSAIYGTIIGTVTDKTGAAVPGATVTVTDVAKGTITSVKTNAAGDYTVPYLVPDVYNVKISFTGFTTYEAKSLEVLADTAPRLDVKLAVGVATTTVEVDAESRPELKTETADVSTVFNDQQVSSLPVGDQNFANLQLLLPGAQILGWSHAPDENPQGSKQIQIDGQAFGGVAYELDGADNQDPILGIIVVNPSMDAVTQTTITTQNFNAEQGKAVSAAVSAQTKSGTNKFHGSVYDFRTGNANLAKEPYSIGPGVGYPAGLKNRGGASIGGPAIKDRFFFFFNYEGQRQGVGTTATDTLPTNLLVQSCLGNVVGPGLDGHNSTPGCDFSQYGNLETAGAGIVYNNSGGSPVAFPDNVIPTAMLSAPALALLTDLAPYAANITGTALTGKDTGIDSNFSEGGSGLFNSNMYTARVDYTLSDKAHAFARFARFTDVLSGAVAFGAAGGPGFGLGGYGGTSTGANDSTVAGMDIAFSPKLITDFRLGYLRYDIIDSKHDAGTNFATTLGIPGMNLGTNITSGSPGFYINSIKNGEEGEFGDGLGIDRCNCPLIEREDQFQIVNNWTRTIGNHAVKAGVDLRYGRNLRVPSDSDRTGLLGFGNGPTSNGTTGGVGFATFVLGEVSGGPGVIAGTSSCGNTAFCRYVSTSTNAKEFQKRTFFYLQDTWRVNHKLTLNYGVRWELYFPESTNAPENAAMLNMADGYLHVAGVGGIPSDMGWTIQKMHQFEPRIGITYQIDPKTVIRAGYGRSFDIGVFGSIFGHSSTQNLPVLANQVINPLNSSTGYAFPLSSVTTVNPVLYPYSGPNGGPAANVFPTVPANGLLPNPGYNVSTWARPNPLQFPTLDAWNLSVQRQLTSTVTITVAYVGNKGTHTLGDGDSRNTNPNEAAINLPGSYSINGQTLSYLPSSDPSFDGGLVSINGNNQTSQSNLLSRYYAGSLAACASSGYAPPPSTYTNSSLAVIPLPAGACGWTNAVNYLGDNQNTNFNAAQVVVAKTFSKGLALNANYNWASAFDEATGYWTWSKRVTYGHDANVRRHQLISYGSYDLPFGKGKQFLPNASKAEELAFGGFQLSSVLGWSSGLPFSLSVNSCGDDIPGSAPCQANTVAGGKLSTSLSGWNTAGQNRNFYNAQTIGGGIFTDPGLSNIGNVQRNSYFGPSFFNTDLGIVKAFPIWERVNIKFRMDAFNAFNHINPGNPGGDIQNPGTISGEGPGGAPRQLEFSLHLQF
jgi:hypothetical protein